MCVFLSHITNLTAGYLGSPYSPEGAMSETKVLSLHALTYADHCSLKLDCCLFMLSASTLSCMIKGRGMRSRTLTAMKSLKQLSSRLF